MAVPFPQPKETMKTRFLCTTLLAASLLSLGGCATLDRTSVSTVGGALVGGLVGNVVGGPAAVIVGAAAGAYVGNKAARR